MIARPCDVTLHLRDGRAPRERIEYCRREPEKPITEAAVSATFNVRTARFLPRARVEKFAGLGRSLERQTTLRRLVQFLRSAA